MRAKVNPAPVPGSDGLSFVNSSLLNTADPNYGPGSKAESILLVHSGAGKSEKIQNQSKVLAVLPGVGIVLAQRGRCLVQL